MNKGKIAVVFLTIAVIAALAGIMIARRTRSPEEGGVTRYEWMKMLCEQTGMTGYERDVPYFDDVDEDDPYFPYIQSAVEWGIIEAASDYNGDTPVLGRDIAMTAMRTIGQEKIRIYLEIDGEITEETYLSLAVEKGLIREEQLTEGFSEDECGQVLATLRDLYFGEFWRDDYLKVTYQSGVVELATEDVLLQAPDCSAVLVTEEAVESLEVGSIIVFEQGDTGLKAAREVAGKDADGAVFLIPTGLDRVVESLVISDITELTFADIVRYYGLEGDVSAVSYLNPGQTADAGISAVHFPIEMNSKGFALSVSTAGEGEERHLEIQATDRGSGVSYSIPVDIPVKLKDEHQIEIEVEIDKIAVGGQIAYSASEGGVQYVDVAVDAHASLRGDIHVAKEAKIPLFKTPVPLGSGFVGVDIQIYLVLSVDGTISIEAELPMEVSVHYEQEKGLKNYGSGISVKDPKIEIDCSAALKLRIEPTLEILRCVNIIDVEADIGVAADADRVMHADVQVCQDISISFPVITISVCGDDDADSLVGALGLSAEWEVISAEDAPIRFGRHYELFPDGRAGFVEECTYREGEEGAQAAAGTEAEAEEGSAFSNTYYTRYGEINQIDCPNFCFDYPDNWTITWEEVRDADEEFTYVEYYGEIIELTSDTGISITYTQYRMNPGAVGNGSAFSYFVEYDITKVMDSNLKPMSFSETEDTDSFMVAEIRQADMNDSNGVNDHAVTYAVLPQSKEGSGVTDLVSLQEICSFYYPAPYSIEAVAPNGYFTEEEKQEVIAILASFRLSAKGQEPEKEVQAGETSEEDQLYAAMKNGDFSYFAGTYEACGVYNDWYGGGKMLPELIFQENGIATGGLMGAFGSTRPETEVSPISVKKNEDGSYLCQVYYNSEYDQCYFYIYPEGVIGENPYTYNDPFLRNTVYIRYIVYDGGTSDIIYYKVED